MMPIVDLHEIKTSLKPGRRLLGLDLGSKTIGLAVSDAALIVASPLETIKRTKFGKDAVKLEKIIVEQDIGGFIMGMPVSMDGTEGPRCQSTRQFAANMLARLEIPIAFWDERLSTAAVERILISEADMNRKRRGEVIDKMAAAYILQGALDAKDTASD